MSLATQVKVPAQVKGAVGGGGGTFTPGGTSDQFLDGTGAPKDLGATDMPSGIDASKMADGSVSNTELQYIGTLTSDAQTQISAKQASITGTPTGTKFARDTGAWSAIADADLPSTSNNATISAISTVANAAMPKAGGTATGDIALGASGRITGTSNNTGNSSNYELIRTTNGWSLGVPTGKDVRIPVAGADQAVVGAAGLTLPTAQTAQFSSPSISNSSESMRFGVATGYGFQWLQTNTSTYIADLTVSRGLVLYNSGSTFDSNQLSGSTSGPVINSTASLRVAISAGGPGTTNPEVCVYGISHTSSAGAIESKAGAVTRASNGTWTDIFDLSKGAYHGDFYLSDSLGDGHARYPISSTTLGTCVDNASGVTYVDAGSVGASNVGLRVNAGKLQINVGSSITASTKFALRFEGTVV